MKQVCLFLSFLSVAGFAQDRYAEKYKAREAYRAKNIVSREIAPSAMQSGSYSVNTITYAPFRYDTGSIVLNGTDDLWANSLPIGFNFCYFGNSYTNMLIGSNGELTFDQTQANGYNNWSITDSLPNTTDLPANTICAAFRDIDPSLGGNIYYCLTGTMPNRKLVISWYNVPLFDNTNTCAGDSNSTFQLVLYEGSNMIDVYIRRSDACTGWNGGYGIIGIQDAAGTSAVVPPNRNYPNTWTAVHEAWRFTPTSGPCFTTGILQTKGEQFAVYPNPASGELYIKANIIGNEYAELYDMTGRKINSVKLEQETTRLDIGPLAPGAYYVKILSANSSAYCAKFIKQ